MKNDPTSLTKPSNPLPTGETEHIEEALAEVFKCLERHEEKRELVEPKVSAKTSAGVLDELIRRGSVKLEGGRVRFSEEGKRQAAAVIRRERLTERLLRDVLDMDEALTTSTVCQLEHVLSEEVTDSICTLLGHPSHCPHERPIPQGECCRKALAAAGPVVLPLERLEPGRKGKVAYLRFSKHPEFDRLLASGIIPGAEFKLIQRFPAFVIEVGAAQLAFDADIAREIFVRPSPRS